MNAIQYFNWGNNPIKLKQVSFLELNVSKNNSNAILPNILYNLSRLTMNGVDLDLDYRKNRQSIQGYNNGDKTNFAVKIFFTPTELPDKLNAFAFTFNSDWGYNIETQKDKYKLLFNQGKVANYWRLEPFRSEATLTWGNGSEEVRTKDFITEVVEEANEIGIRINLVLNYTDSPAPPKPTPNPEPETPDEIWVASPSNGDRVRNSGTPSFIARVFGKKNGKLISSQGFTYASVYSSNLSSDLSPNSAPLGDIHTFTWVDKSQKTATITFTINDYSRLTKTVTIYLDS